MCAYLPQIIIAFGVAILTAFFNNLLQNKKFEKEFEKLRKQQQLDVRKELIKRSHDTYLKFARAWGLRFSGQKSVKLSQTDRQEIIGLLFEIMYCSHDNNIKVLAYETIQEFDNPKTDFKNLEKLNRAIIDAPVKDANLPTQEHPN